MAKYYEAIVVGAGHAGIEAGAALARKGHSVLLATLSLNSIGFMACNPNIGGTAKGHLVKEIDAMGGVMGSIADKATIQTRMLNLANGPAVHSLRNQVDKAKYHRMMKLFLERQKNLTLLEDEVIEIVTENGKIKGVVMEIGHEFIATDAVVLTTGVYLSSRIIIGDYLKNSGPSGFQRAEKLTSSLEKLGLPIVRFKTGTPPRVLKSSIDLEKTIPQSGDNGIYPFSEDTDFAVNNSFKCYLTYTNAKTHKIILDNIDRSPLYNGCIEGTGPRYCPSIETKLMRFPDKARHQVFIEPEGEDTDEMYLQGISTSMPYDVQEKMVHSINGLENAVIMRYGYAIEYDCLDPLCLLPSLAVKGINGLFGAGQINGSSGYEEAGAQGLIAGANAALYLENKPPMILRRDEAYTGVLIDDLCTKGTHEPYRMMTSRAEYRLFLRQDNADMRLTEKAYKNGLVPKERYDKFLEKKERKNEIYNKLNLSYSPEDVRVVFENKGETVPKSGISGKEILKRTHLNSEDLIKIDNSFGEYDIFLLYQAETEIKYEGYLVKQERSIREMKKMEQKALGEAFDYDKVDGLRLEAKEKLKAVKPLDLAQAGRISGVNPADIVVIMVHLQKNKKG